MKIADLFVSLGIRVNGADKLDKVDERLRTSAASAGAFVENMAKLEAVMLSVKTAASQVSQTLSQATAQVAQATNALQQQATGAAQAQQGLVATTQQAQQAQQALTGATQQAGQAQQKLNTGLVNIRTNSNQATISVSKLGLSYAGLLLMTKRLVTQSFESAIAMKNFSQETGLSITNLQQWQYQAVQNNVAAERMNATLSNLQTTIADIALGNRPLPQGFTLLGISADMSPEKQLELFRANFRKLRPGIARSLAQSLGIGDDVYRVLISDTERLNRRFVVTQEELAKITKLTSKWNEWWFTLKQTATKAFAALSTPVVWLMGALENVLKTITRILDVAMDLAGVLLSLAFPGIEMDERSAQLYKALSSPETKNAVKSTLAGPYLSGKMPEFLERLLSGNPRLNPSVALPPAPSNTSNNSTSIEVNINGAKDPAATGKEVQRALRQMLIQTAYQAPLPAA